MNRPRDRASAAGLLPRMEARPNWSKPMAEGENFDEYIVKEWRPWKDEGMRPCDWIDANWRYFLHGPNVTDLAVAHATLDPVSGVYMLSGCRRRSA